MTTGLTTWYESRPSNHWGLDWSSCLARDGVTCITHHAGGINAACAQAQRVAAQCGGMYVGYRKGQNKG